MPLLNYTTRVGAEQSISEISRALSKVGARRIMHDYDDNGYIVAMSFQLELNGNSIAFRLPTDWRPVMDVLEAQKVEAKRRGQRFRVEVDQDQALRVAWRITKDWIEAQCAYIETMMVTTAQVFLPYAVTKDGQTLYEHIAGNPNLLLGDGQQ